ncbi:MAG: hypothetical protein JSU06_11400 [Actinobacteria bacterium]|nr:hypothetical protein [Actinomycetota bacterium]
MSRRRTFALLAAFAALAALLSACGGGGGSSADPQQVIESATLEGVESGNIDLSLEVKAEGKHGGEVKVELNGPFQSTGKNSIPELALEAKANGEAGGEKVDFEGGLTVLGDRAYIGYKGKEYEVEPTTFGFIKSGFEEAQQEGAKESKGGEATACQKAATSLKLEEFVQNLENAGSEEVEGVKTVKLSGDLEPKSAIDTVIKLLETPACASELEATGSLPLGELKAQQRQLTDAIKTAHVEVYVGESDHIIRKVVADLSIEPPGTGEKAEVELDLTLGQVNEPQTIKAPSGAEPLQKLFLQLGINPIELLGMMEGGGSQNLGGLLEGVTGAMGGGASAGGGNSGAAELELPSGGPSKEFTECIKKANGATDLQKCATLME